MSSSKANDDGHAAACAAGLLVDPESVLVRESAQLVEPGFLAALCHELTSTVGATSAGAALVQIGCLHGLRDASGSVADLLSAPSAQSCVPGAAAMPARVRTRAHGPLTLEGEWPEGAEAEAWLTHQAPASEPVCVVSAGYTSGWLSQLFDTELVVVETECRAAGAPQCRFVARERATWRSEGTPRAREQAELLPVAAMRDALVPAEPEDFPLSQSEAGDTVIHIWGPVMVVPYTGAEEGLQAIELLRHDPSASRVCVVILDITDASIDEGFDASALEQMIDTAEHLGAETVLAGVSPLSERAVATLDPQPVMVCKDLHSAIATGFQVADARMRPL